MSNILLMDDQEYVYDFLFEDLAGEGHLITHVKETDELMETIQDSNPDLILLDLFINGFEGLDLLQEIKRNQPDLPILILSAYDSFMDDPRVTEADDYVVKDFHTDKLIEKINHILNEKKRGYHQENPYS